MPQQGQLTLKLDSADGHLLDFGKAREDKRLEYAVEFPRSFAAPPLVHLGVVGITSAGDTNTNYKPDLAFDLEAINVTAQGFTLQARLGWYNTSSTVTIAWLALNA